MSEIFNKKEAEKKERRLLEKIAQLEKIKKDSNPKKPVIIVEFSWKLLLFILAILGVLFWSQQIFTALIFIFISIVIMSAVLPLVKGMMKKGISKGWSIAITYFLFIILFLAVLSVVVIPFVGQIGKLVDTIPIWIKNFLFNIEDIGIFGFSIDPSFLTGMITDWFEKISLVDNFEKILKTVGGVFSWTSIIVAAIIASVYLVMEHNNLLDFILIKIISDEKKHRVKKLVLDVEDKLGRWLIGQGVISTFAAIYSGIVLTILNVPFALPLAVFTGFMGVIPSLGSTIAGIVMAFVALVAVGPVAALILLAAFILYQPLENSVLTPKVMGNAVGLRPMIVLFGVIISLIFFGIIGGFVAVPVMVLIKIIYEFYIDLQKIQAKGSI